MTQKPKIIVHFEPRDKRAHSGESRLKDLRTGRTPATFKVKKESGMIMEDVCA